MMIAQNLESRSKVGPGDLGKGVYAQSLPDTFRPGHHTETGPGVFESALAYQPVQRMADNATLFKYIAKTTGYRFGVMPTFMAKPYADQPGCSGHVHVSLRNKAGENIFAVKESEVKDGRAGAAFEDTKRISEVAEWFLAGVLKGLPDIVRLARIIRL